jgi:hypothetical protein
MEIFIQKRWLMVKLHCGALKCTDLVTAAEVIGMECFFQIKKCRGDGCPNEYE